MTDRDTPGLSYDPRTWGRQEPDAPGRIPDPAVAPIAPRRGRARILLPAAAAAVLIGGASVWWLSRPDETGDAGPVGGAGHAIQAPSPTNVGDSRRTLVLAGPGELAAALRAAGIDQGTADGAARRAGDILGDAPGEIRLSLDLTGTRLARLEATRVDGAGVRLVAEGSGFRAERLAARVTDAIRAVAGEMDDNSFYTSAVTAGVTDSLISDFAAAFSFDLDFQREVRAGDRFEAVFAQPVNPSGQPAGAPRLLFVSMRTVEKSLRFYRFRPPGGEEGWFDDNGRGNTRSLMRTPIDGARVTSRFGMRVHPILGYQRLHRGTDFAAPTGTPVYASGDATVEFAQPRGGAGNMVRLQHDNGWFTHYFHLSAFAQGMGPGVRVRQGQLIGLVGTTGRSTGPHLHYEVWINGAPVDSQGIDTGTGTTLNGAALRAFRAERDRIDRARAAAVGR